MLQRNVSVKTAKKERLRFWSFCDRRDAKYNKLIVGPGMINEYVKIALAVLSFVGNLDTILLNPLIVTINKLR